MSSAAEILVIILSIFLAVFLVLGIALLVYLIKLTKQIREVTKTAENTMNTIDSAVSGVAKVVSPMFMAKMFTKFMEKFKKEATKLKAHIILIEDQFKKGTTYWEGDVSSKYGIAYGYE